MMGGQLALKVHEVWGDRLEHAEFRLLAYMALRADDSNGAPRFWEGKDAMVAAIYGATALAEDQAAELASRRGHVKAYTRKLCRLGALRVILKPAPGRNTVYSFPWATGANHGPLLTGANNGHPSRRQRGPTTDATGANDGSERGPTTDPLKEEKEVKEPSGGADADASAAHADGAETKSVVAAWVGAQPKRPPSRVIGQVSREVAQLLNSDGYSAAEIAQALDAWQARALHPSALASVMHEITTPRKPLDRARPGEIDWDAAYARAAARDAGEPTCATCQQPESYCRRVNSNPKMPDHHDFIKSA
jgi:hypothetical protein